MLKTVVIYRSLSGFTKKYAEWIAEELKADIYDAREAKVEKISEYDLIVFGGSLHAVGINGVKIIKQNLPRLAGKKIVVFAVGASPPKDNVVDEIKKNNFSSEEQKNLTIYYLRGGFNYSKLNRTNKILMMLLRVKLSLKKNRTPDEKGMLAAYAKPVDCTRKENIKQIIEYVQSLT